MIGPRGHLSEQELYESLVHQASSGDWTRGFTLRAHGDDPWGLGIFHPDRVHFHKPPEQHDKVVELRQLIAEVVQPFFISQGSWDELVGALERLYTNPELCRFVEARRGNLFVVTPHVQFHDLGIVAAASLSVRSHLEKDNPFSAPDDPGSDHTIVVNRAMTLLDHADFRLLTGLPILEGLMLPLADVVTTLSANGSARLARRMLGRDLTSTMNGLTRERLVQMTTKGSQIIMLAPSGTQASRQRIDAYSEALVIPEASHGTMKLMIELNQGEPITHRNAVAGLFIDCPSITPAGQIEPVDAGIGLCHEVWVPTEASQLELIMKATIRSGVGHGRRGGPEFRYASAEADPHLRRGQSAQLEKVKLTELR
jgi:hypothetical protein